MLFTNVWNMWTTSLRCWWPICSLGPKKYDSTSLTPPNPSAGSQSYYFTSFCSTMARRTYAVHVRFGLERLLDMSSICKWYLYPNNSIIFNLLNNTRVPTYFLSVNPWTGLIMDCSIAYGLLDKNRFSIWNLDFQFWIEFELNPTKPHYATGPSSLEWNHKNK